MLGWTPQDGETVHLNRDNSFDVPAGRYKLARRSPSTFELSGLTSDACVTVALGRLICAETAGTLTPITAAAIEREALEVRLRLHSPLRNVRCRQHDASDLALFRSADEPGLI